MPHVILWLLLAAASPPPKYNALSLVTSSAISTVLPALGLSVFFDGTVASVRGGASVLRLW